jgi:biotin carboxyl carrier protein
MENQLSINGECVSISLEEENHLLKVCFEEKCVSGEVGIISEKSLVLQIENHCYRVDWAEKDGKIWLAVNGHIFTAEEPDEADAGCYEGDQGADLGRLLITSPMPGKVIKIDVVEGEAVRKNQTLAVVEAMKMENEIKAGREGRVLKIYVHPGDLVNPETPLIELDAED